MNIIKSIEHEQLKNKIPVLDVGNTVKVHVRIKEGNRERIQIFEGIIIKKQGGGLNQTFTVRRISYGVGVEKTFLVHSPLVEKVEVIRVGKARRAKLFYLRDRIGKASRTKERLGARIENKEIVVKEEMVEEPVVEETAVAPEEAPAIETTEVVTQEVVDTVKEEVVEIVKEAPAAEVVEEKETVEAVKEEAVVTEKQEAVEEKTEEPVAEEVKEEIVETVKEAPVVEEAKEEKTEE